MSRELTAEQKARLRELLGDNPPEEVYDPNFYEAYEKVVDADPELAFAWQESLQEEVTNTSKVKLPAERVAGRARRTKTIRGFVDRVATREVVEEDTPTPAMPDQRKLTVTVFAVVFTLAALLIAGSLIFTPNDTVEAATPPEDTTAQVEQPTEPPEPVEPELPVVEPLPITPPTPEPVEPRDVVTSQPPVTPPPVRSAPPVNTPPPATPPSAEEGGPTGGSVYRASRVDVHETRSTVYRESTPTETTATVVFQNTSGTGEIITPANNRPPTASASPVIYQESTPNNSIVFNNDDNPETSQVLVHNTQYEPRSGSTLIYENTSSTRTPGTATPRPAATPTNIGTDTPPATLASNSTNRNLQLGAALAGTPNTTSNTQGAGAPGTTGSAGNPTPQPSQNPVTLRRPDGSTFQLGERIPAHLVTSATILDGIPAPVIAETQGEWCNSTSCPTYTFIGTARLLGGNRVVINFNQAVTPNGTQNITAIALSAEYTTSIPAHIRDETPTIAPDLVRASLNGVAAYADNLSNATRTIIDEHGNTVQEDILPDLTSLIAGNAARALGLPENATTVVRLAELEPNTPVIITIGLTY